MQTEEHLTKMEQGGALHLKNISDYIYRKEVRDSDNIWVSPELCMKWKYVTQL